MDTQSNASDLVRLWQGQNPINQAQMRRFHDELIQYLENPEATLFVRGRPIDRRKTFVTDNGLLIAPTDNSPAWWAHKMVSTPNSVIDFKRIPTHMFDTGRDGFNTINRNGYYVAHIIAAKIGTADFTQWSREDAVARFVCNIHPINHFYVPMEHRNLGENPEFILAAARLAEEMYGETWNEFVEFAGDSGLQYLINLTNKPSQTFAPSIPRQSQRAPVLPSASGRVEYSSTRLHFKAKFIEPLGWDDSFRVHTPFGIFEFTKRQFYETFPKIVVSDSYRIGGNYHGATLHFKASAFLIFE